MSKVNDALRQEVIKLFTEGFRESMMPGVNPDDVLVKEQSKLHKEDHEEFFLLTVSSQLFRLFVIIHFSKDRQSESFVSEVLGIPQNNLTEAAFYDYMGELGNAFCGYLKRELNKSVPHLGMSTPNRLGRDCIRYMTSLNSDLEHHAVAEYKGEPLFHASTYLVADQVLDYDIKQSFEEQETESGDLEFF